MDAQTAVEVYNSTLQAGFAGIALILALAISIGAIVAWRIVGVWNRRSGDQSELVQAVVTTSQAAKQTADHNADVLKEIRIMRENQATMVGFLTEVDTNVKLVKEQGVKAGQDIRLTYDDLVQFRDAVLPVLREIRSSLEAHDNHAGERHKTLLNAVDKSGSVIVGDIDDLHTFLDGLNDKITTIKNELSSMEAAQRKIITYVKPIDTDELTDGGNSLLSA